MGGKKCKVLHNKKVAIDIQCTSRGRLFGNVFAEDIPIKSSLIRENWLKEIKTY